ncbi:hypothetical protein QJS04_geneDACA014322 [Acorus gramineus]|uniref:HAT C-terminal dimerisation domain-containing protein n=1 Tax=Acorus gramineus TaxID=55184 RepID=A0AAV9AMV9_ACOGR|nr:hypothetical protein QJS04_geneDACA014322 [Acorus gramineus]
MKFTTPLVQVLRMVDGDEKPSLPYVWHAMENAKSKIKENLNYRERDYRTVISIIDRRWKHQMRSSLYHAAYYLNPCLFYGVDRNEVDNTHFWGFLDVLEKMVPDVATQDVISIQLNQYRDAVGVFGRDIARRQRATIKPTEWWSYFGVDVPELKMLAMKILSLTSSASTCKRCWSTFEQLHTKKRNRLKQKRLNDLVYVMYNQKLKERFSKLHEKPRFYDPISTTVEDDEEWITDAGEERVFDDEGECLTWNEVERQAFGDDPDGSPPTRTYVRGGSRSGSTIRRSTQEEAVAEENVHEEDEEVPVQANVTGEQPGVYIDEDNQNENETDFPQWVREGNVEFASFLLGYYYQ